MVSPEHLILAMLKDERSVVSKIFMQFNIDYASYYKQVAELGNIAPSDQNNIRAQRAK